MKSKDSEITRREVLRAAGAICVQSALWSTVEPLALLHAAETTPLVSAAAEKLVPTMCAMCGPSQGCGINAVVRNGRFVGIEPLKDAPLNRGKNCGKAHAAPQWVYSPQRLRYPLKRVGERGEGKFKRITWNEALDTIASKLKEQKEQFGPESLAILSPAARSYSSYFRRFLAAHGSPNYAHSGICAMQKGFSFQYTLGSSPTADIQNTRLLIIWAKQPIYAGSAKGGVRELLAAKARGVKIIAVKPTMEPDAALADIWVPIRPGTDAAFALALLNVVITEKLYDREFVGKWTYGFDRLVPHVQKYTPEWAERISGVPAAQTREVARLFATTKHACIETGNGFEHSPSCNDAVRSVAILIAITGNLDRRGGNLLSAGPGGMEGLGSPGIGRSGNSGSPDGPRRFAGLGGPGAPAPKSKQSGRPGPGESRDSLVYTQEQVNRLVAPEFPLPFQTSNSPTSAYYRIFESVLTGKPYPIRTIIAPGTQPVTSTRGTRTVLEALKKVDFYVVLDVARTADMNYADIVIPISTMYEVDHPFEGRGNWIMPRRRVIEPIGESKSDYEFWIELGARMGYGKHFWHGSVEEWKREELKGHGITLEELLRKPEGIVRQNARQPVYEKYEQAFSARSSRFSKAPYLPQQKVAIYNTTFEEAGFNPLPEWREPPESLTATPELLNKYPLLFSDFHTSKVYNASWLRNLPHLREVAPDPTLQIHPETAQARGIRHGDWVVVESPHGTIRLKADVNPGIRRDTVMALHGWWEGCDALGKPNLSVLNGGANTNSMYDTSARAFDPIVTAMSSQTLVQVRKQPLQQV